MNKSVNCGCIAKMNKALESRGVAVSYGWNFATGGEFINVALFRPDFSKKKIDFNLQAAFCPFCGVKYAAPTDPFEDDTKAVAEESAEGAPAQ